MTNRTDDELGHLGREQSGGPAAKQDQTRADSDRGYGAREGQRESARDDDPDRGARAGGDFGDSTPHAHRGEQDRPCRQDAPLS